MAGEKLDVIVKAINLMKDIISTTSNRKRYPVKYIQLVKRIQNNSMDIYECLMEANRLNVITSKTKRIELQTKAITSCDKMSCFIEMSMELGLISSNKTNELQKKISDIKYMTIAWREKDKVR